MTMTIAELGDHVKESYKPAVDEDFPYIGLEHVEPDSLHLSSYSSSTEVISTKYKFQKGDILFGTLRPYFRKLIVAPFDGVCSTEFCVIRQEDSAERDFLFYAMTQSKFIEYATKNSNGARPRTKWELFSDFEIKKFSSLERNKIGSILSTYDDLIKNNRRRINLLEQSSRLLYREWFIYLRFPGHEHVKITDGVPEEWEKVKLGEKVILNYGKALKAENRIEGSYPVYGSSGIIGTHKEPLVKGPGIIVGRKGNVGSVFWSSNDFYPIDTVYFINSEMSNYYLYNSLKNMQFINSDGAVPGLNRNYACSRSYLIPEYKFLSHFEEIVSPIYEQIHKLVTYNEKLVRARDLLLPHLMNGEIAV